MSQIYYNQKLIKLIEKLFINGKDAREKLIENEDLIFTVYLASNSNDLDTKTKSSWNKIWNDLNTNKELTLTKDRTISSFRNTVSSKRKKTLSNYLLLIFEEYSKII